jgi:hypothetical protein
MVDRELRNVRRTILFTKKEDQALENLRQEMSDSKGVYLTFSDAIRLLILQNSNKKLKLKL